MFKNIYHTDKKVLMISLILSILVFIAQSFNIYINSAISFENMRIIILLFFGVYFFVFWMFF